VSWIAYGLRRGILTTRYPFKPDSMPDAYRGAIDALDANGAEQRSGAEQCLSDAIAEGVSRASVDALRCYQCGACARAQPSAFRTSNRFAVTQVAGDPRQMRALIKKRTRAWGKSVHLRHVDAGSDGSEEQELQAIFNPFYDANRLGIFLTASPRHADILVVTGVVTKPMAEPLRRAYEAMPEPKMVVALGTSACSGGIFAKSEAILGAVSTVLPVDIFVPGAPPSPLSILHGLWVAMGRALGESSTV
jgi:Ni,Fe-hydrogenase III small subunit